MLKCLIALTSLLSAAAIAAPAWTWVDDQGRRHYSDRPVEGATQIELAGPQTFSGGATSQPALPVTQQQAAETAGQAYTVLDVISPADGETLTNIGGTLTMEVAVYPRLQAAHQIDVIFNGERRNLGSRSLSLTIADVFRGEHSIQAVIVAADGSELLRSAPITVFVRQTSVLTPAPQRAPPPSN
jgi:hypothetical protein